MDEVELRGYIPRRPPPLARAADTCLFCEIAPQIIACLYGVIDRFNVAANHLGLWDKLVGAVEVFLTHDD